MVFLLRWLETFSAFGEGTRGSGQAQIVSNGHHLHKDSSTTLPQKKQHGKPQTNDIYLKSKTRRPLVAGAWTERKKMFLGGSFLKLADDNKYI